MRRRMLAWIGPLLVVLSLIPALTPAAARADNPIVQTIYTADPAPLVYNGRVYLYTGHDEDNSTYFTMKEWRGWSSPAMGHLAHPRPPPPPPTFRPGPAHAP